MIRAADGLVPLQSRVRQVGPDYRLRVPHPPDPLSKRVRGSASRRSGTPDDAGHTSHPHTVRVVVKAVAASAPSSLNALRA